MDMGDFYVCRDASFHILTVSAEYWPVIGYTGPDGSAVQVWAQVELLPLTGRPSSFHLTKQAGVEAEHEARHVSLLMPQIPQQHFCKVFQLLRAEKPRYQSADHSLPVVSL